MLLACVRETPSSNRFSGYKITRMQSDDKYVKLIMFLVRHIHIYIQIDIHNSVYVRKRGPE